MVHTLPTTLLGEIVQYLDITEDRFLPGFRKQWIKATRFRTDITDSYVCYRVNNKIHSWNDLPAVQYYNMIREWYSRGNRHRSHGRPALTMPNGHWEWYFHGQRINNPSQDVWTVESVVRIVSFLASLLVILILYLSCR